MKQLAVFAIAVCTFAASCKQEDPTKGSLGRRTVEPWLTGVTEWRSCKRTLHKGHVVEEADCGPSEIPPAAECDTVITNHAEAVAAFASQPVCLDIVITKLEEYGSGLPAAQSDLAAAYYVRAQRDDEPADLLLAFDAARLATSGSPSSPQARFNRALILEALGLGNDAITSWDELQSEARTPWTDEARRHRDKLQYDRDHDAATQWALQRSRLGPALRRNDTATVAQLIHAFPGSAQTYFEEEVLARWGQNPSEENIMAAQTLAAAISKRLGGDPYDMEIVKTIEASAENPGLRASLRSGHVVFREARNEERSRHWAVAAERYEKARELLHSSPLRLHAQLGHALARSFESKTSFRALPLFDPLEADAEAGGYIHLIARIQTTRAFVLAYERGHVESLAASDRALEKYLLLQDDESARSLQSRRIGYLRIVGLRGQAWRIAIANARQVHSIVSLKDQHFLLGEAADAAADLGHPLTGLLYRNDAIGTIRRWLANTPKDDAESIHRLRDQLSIALRSRAAIALDVGDQAAARRDLDEMNGLIDPTEEGQSNLRNFRTRLREVEGRAWLPNRPDRAIASFTRALEDGSNDEIPTFRARVLVRRAEAYQLLGKVQDAENDLNTALGELRAQEVAALASRRRGDSERLWSTFFERSQDTYRVLIRYYADLNLDRVAFRYAEQARAFEPLDLVLGLKNLPPSFRALTAGGNSVTLEDIQRLLPHGTFLIEYSVHENRTYTWVISRDGFSSLVLPTGAAEVSNWTNAVQTAARKQEDLLLNLALSAPYDSLVASPLGMVEKLPGGRDPARRLVFIPDGAMHGLPLAALKNRKTGRHLIEDATVEVAGSATLYVFSILRNKQLSTGQPPTALLIGAPEVSPQLSIVYGLGPLHGALREADSLRSVYAPHAVVRTRQSATVPEFLEQAPRHTVVHVGAHAVANPKEPTRSTLFLAPSPGHTGALEAEELMKRLQPGRTKLVVLAACSSAGGVPVGPEGLAPLVRPFLTSGVPAVVGSLWDVNDATAEPLLVSFHRHYQASGDAAVALQSAQRKLLGENKKAGRKPALAWAPFQVIGH